MTVRLLHISAHTRRSPSKPAVYIEKHAQLRDEIETARVEAALSDEALMEALAEIVEVEEVAPFVMALCMDARATP